MTTVDPHKYVTFKRDQFSEWARTQDDRINDVFDLILEDAVVIRKKDTFAPSALYSYATAVQSAIELLEGSQVAGIVVDPSAVDRLRDLADYFAGEADHARQLQGRIPD